MPSRATNLRSLLDRDLDAFLPVQLLEPARMQTPETRLMGAVLEDAIREYQHLARARSRYRLRQRAALERWFASNQRDHPFAFSAICDALDLDASSVRREVARWMQRQVGSGPVALPCAPPLPIPMRAQA